MGPLGVGQVWVRDAGTHLRLALGHASHLVTLRHVTLGAHV